MILRLLRAVVEPLVLPERSRPHTLRRDLDEIRVRLEDLEERVPEAQELLDLKARVQEWT